MFVGIASTKLALQNSKRQANNNTAAEEYDVIPCMRKMLHNEPLSGS